MDAVRKLQRHLPEHPKEGKMWGILVVEYKGDISFLSAYSGQIDKATETSLGSDIKCCPPVFDYLQPDGYFKRHEREITDMNSRIAHLSSSDDYLKLKTAIARLQAEADEAIRRKRDAMIAAKVLRDKRRSEGFVSENEQKAMIRQSQYLKAEVHRAKVYYKGRLDELKAKARAYEQEIASLRRSRKLKSDHLQAWLFSHFILLNGWGEKKAMPDIFRDYYVSQRSSIVRKNVESSMLCPTGAGECCEPKLLQYAFVHGMRPLRMAAFWWGPSPANELRRHGCFYPACSGRCKPILSWMLRGVDVDANPLDERSSEDLRIVYEDDYLAVVDKPSGMLSVPGKGHRESVVGILTDRWQGHWTPLAVHRLDMATSGLMIVAKDARVQSSLQRAFERREVTKTYIAIVERELHPMVDDHSTVDPRLTYIPPRGRIRLSLRPDPLDRPRQVVDMLNGKPALTEYEVMSASNGESRLRLSPKTGRTHQLRVHCAAPLGLNAPIKGDELYGTPADRLYLHAAEITFRHPVTGQTMAFKSSPEF